MKAATALAAALGFWLGGTALAEQTSPAPGTLNVLCGVDEDWCAAMEAAFERHSGLEITMTRLSTGEILDAIRMDRAAPTVDVWWGGTGDTHLQAAAEGLLEAYTSPHEADLLPWAQNFHAMSGSLSSGVYAGALGFAYNADLLAQRRLPAPSCWNDLTDPAYRGDIQIGNPETSGTAYTALATLVQLFGEDEAFAYLARLGANVSSYTKSGAAPVKAAARGDTLIGISFIHDAVTQKLAGSPLVIVAPCEGTGYEIGSMSIVKGARNMENAKIWYDWALKPEVQSRMKEAKSFQLPSNKNAEVPEEAPRFEQIKLIDYDFTTFGSSETRKALLERWDREVGAIAQ